MKKSGSAPSVITCPQCGLFNAAEESVCQLCGSTLHSAKKALGDEKISTAAANVSPEKTLNYTASGKKVCPHCGFENVPDVSFCEKCFGSLITESAIHSDAEKPTREIAADPAAQSTAAFVGSEAKPDSSREKRSAPGKPLILTIIIGVAVIALGFLIFFLIRGDAAREATVEAPAVETSNSTQETAPNPQPERVGTGAETAEQLVDQEPEENSIIVAMDSDQPDSNLQSFENELFVEIAAGLGATFDRKYMSFDAMFLALECGEADLAIGAIGYTDERQRLYDTSITYFTDPYYGDEYCILLPKNSRWTDKVDRILNELLSNGWIDAELEWWGLTRSGNYLLPDSADRYLTDADLDTLSWEECCLARNEIYARHGRIFATPEIRAYFEAQPWYEGTISGASFDAQQSAYLNSIESSNVRFILDYENRVWGGSYY